MKQGIEPANVCFAGVRKNGPLADRKWLGIFVIVWIAVGISALEGNLEIVWIVSSLRVGNEERRGWLCETCRPGFLEGGFIVLVLLPAGLFSQLWDFKDILEKVKVVEGDITQDDLGFNDDDREELLSNVNIVIHSAAAVALDDPIKKTLRNNYLSTYRLLELCKQMPHLKSYAHVSTAFVNISHERGSVVKEKIYPLVKGDMVSHIWIFVPRILCRPLVYMEHMVMGVF